MRKEELYWIKGGFERAGAQAGALPLNHHAGDGRDSSEYIADETAKSSLL